MAKDIEKKIVDISSFFTTTRQKEGVWFEPKIDGAETGIEFKILGKEADDTIVAFEEYSKEHGKLADEKDLKKKSNLEREASIKLIASCITDFRGKDGAEITTEEGILEYSEENLHKILYESADLRTALFEAILEPTNFMKKNS